MPLIPARGIWQLLLDRLFVQGQRSPWQRPTRTARPDLELLEHRQAPATLTVNSLLDNDPTQAESLLSLRAAILLIDNAGNSTTAFHRALTAGEQAQIDTTTNPFGADDTIVFDSSLAGQTIMLSGTALPVEASMSINGPASANVILNGNAMSRLFDVDDQDPSNAISATLSKVTLTDGNAGADYGGAILNDGTLTLANCTVSDSTALQGGGIDNEGTLTVRDSTISDNNGPGVGGGIYSSGPLIVSGSTIAANESLGGTGGGIATEGGLTLINSTIVGNGAVEGGGIENGNNLTVLDSTITGNYTVYLRRGFGAGGGIDDIGNTTLIGSIVAGNQAFSGPADISTYGISGNNNLIGDGNGLATALTNGVDGNQIGTTANPLDPLLGPLANNGGPTQTMALLPGSPALNAGGPFTRLAAPVGASDTTILVDTTTDDSNPADEFVIQIDSEQILVNIDASNSSILDVDQRGYNGTTGAGHDVLAGVFLADDQRGQPRIVNGQTDIGAVEMTRTPIGVTAQPPSSVTAGAGFGLVAQAEDGSGNLDDSFDGVLTASVLAGNGALTGTVTALAQNGVATFSGLTLDVAGSYALFISGFGFAGQTTAFTVVAAPATQLLTTTPTPSVVTTGAGFGIAFSAVDPFNNVDTNYSGSVTVALSPGVAGNLGGTLTEPVVSGVATFAGLAIDTAGASDSLQAASGSLPTATSNSFTVSDDRLVVNTPPPGSVAADEVFGFVVQVEDASGNVDQNYDGNVTVLLSPSSFLLGGTVTVQAQLGVATFERLYVNLSGTYPLSVSAGNLAILPLGSLGVIAYASQLVETAPPPPSVTVNTAFGFVVKAEDNNYNVDTNYSGNVLVTLNGPGNLGGTVSEPVVDGVAAFTNLTVNQGGQDDTLSVSSGYLQGTDSDPFNVTSATKLSVFVEGQPNPGAPFTVRIDAEDANGQIDPNYNGPVTVSLSTNPTNATLSGAENLQLENGSDLASLTINNVGSGYVLQAAAVGLTSNTSYPFDVTAPLPASQLSGSVEGNAFTNSTFSIQVEAEDADFNPASAYSGNVMLTLLNGGGAVFGGTLTEPASGGFASFGDLTIDRPGSYRIQATSGGLTPITIPVTVHNDQLVVPLSPSAIAGTPFGFTVQAQDGAGNVDSSFNGTVTASIVSLGPLGNQTTETKTAQASAGMATFSGFTLTPADQSYNVNLTAAGAATGSTFVSVSAAPANHLVVTVQPPPLDTVGAGFNLTILAEDPYGNTDTNDNANVALTFAANPGGAALGGTVDSQFSFGAADYSGLTVSNIGTGYTLQASSGSFNVVSSAFNVTALGIATQLQVTAQPPANVRAGAYFGLQVSAEDSFGTVASSYSGNVTLALTGNGGNSLPTAGVQGQATEPISNGVATFSGLSITQSGFDDILTATSPGLADTTSQDFTVNAAAAIRLVVAAPFNYSDEESVVTGSRFQVNVFADDQYGNTDTSFNGAATVTLAANPTNASLSGALSAPFANGEANVSNLTINQPGSGYTLNATAAGLSAGVSPAFNVTNDKFFVTTDPPNTVAEGSPFGFAVAAEDGSGAVDPSFNGSVTVALPSPDPFGGVLGGTRTVQAKSGVATFSGLTLTKVPQTTYEDLVVSASGVGSGFANLEVTTPTAGPATHLAVLFQPTGSVVAGTNFEFNVAAEDANGIVNPSAAGNVTIALSANPSNGALGGTLTLALANGEAFFALTLSAVGTGYAITATSSGLSPATSAPINVTAAPGTQLVPLTSPQTLSAGAPSAPITLQIQDDEGNIVPAGTGGLTFTLISSSSGGAFFDANGNTLANATIAIPAGATTVSFEYSDSNPGTPTLTVAAPGFVSATQQESVTNAPGFSNASTTTFIVGKSGVNGSGMPFTFRTGGDPAATLTATGVPAWATFAANPDGTATLAGTPPAVTGSYTFNVSAVNGVTPSAIQVFTLDVIAPPTFTASPNANVTLLAGTPATAIVASTINPLPTKTTLTISPALPAGLTFTDNGKGTATITGTPKAGSAPQVFTITARNVSNSVATVAFTLTVNAVPVITTQPKAQSVTLGNVATFTAAATGFPVPTVQWQMKQVGGTFGNIQGQTSPTYSFTPTLADIGDQFQAVFSNPFGATTNKVLTSVVGLTILTTAPKITTQPTNQTVAVGDQVTFSAAASGDPTPTVQWQLGNRQAGSVGTFSPIPNQMSPTLSFTTTQSESGEQLRAVFTNAAGSATASVVTLTVDLPPVIMTPPPQMGTFTAGKSATISAAAMGTPTPTVQWQISSDGVDFTNIAKATSPTLTFTPTAAMDGDQVQAAFTNAVGQAITSTDTLTVQFPPAIVIQPTSQAIAAIGVGNTVTFTAAASGDPVPTVQWQPVGGTPIANATSPTFTFTPTQADIGMKYEAVFKGLGGATATTNAVGFSVDVAPTITTQPDPMDTFVAGKSASVRAAATGTPTPTVQWQISTDGVDFTNIPKATSPTYTFTPTAAMDGAELQAVFTNPLGQQTTTPDALTINYPPAIITQPTPQTVTLTNGVTVTFTAAASGEPAPTVQWKSSPKAGGAFTGIMGATSPSFTFAPTALNNGYQYEAVFTNKIGTATTKTVGLTVNVAPSVTTQPQSGTVAAGKMVTVTAAASGTPAPTVIWQESTDGGLVFSNIVPAVTTTTLTFKATASLNGAEARAVFTNVAGQVITMPATLTVTQPLAFTSAASAAFTVGQKGSFTVKVQGLPVAMFSQPVLPAGLKLTDNGNDTATISGTPQAGTGGTHVITLSVSNGETPVMQTFTLSVNQPPIFISAASDTFTLGQANSFATTISGFPAATTFAETGTLPTGVTFSKTTGMLTGTPKASAASQTPYTITISASDGLFPPLFEVFELTVSM